MKESQRDDLTLYKDYADPALYEEAMKRESTVRKTAARHIYVDISMKYVLPDDMTPAQFAKIDKALSKSGSSLSQIVNNRIKKMIEHSDKFAIERKTEKFKAEYAAYLADANPID